jgi:hypothetical protein
MIGFINAFFTISFNQNQLQRFTSNLQPNPSSLTVRGLAPYSHSRSTSHLILFCTTYTVSRRTHRKRIRCPVMYICEPHRKHLLLYCCIYSTLHSNGSYPIVACVFFVAEMCLLSRCLATGLYVTIYIYICVCVCV